MSHTIRSQQLSKAETNLREFAGENLRAAIKFYLHVFRETEPNPEDALRRYATNVIEESLGLTGRELPG